MQLKRILPVTLALMLCAAHAVLAAPGEEFVASVRVAAETVAEGERLTLGDVAEVRCGGADECARLRNVSLGYAPRVGATREIRREQLATALAAAGFAGRGVRLEAPAVAYVRRASQEVDAARVREAIERAVLADLRASSAEARLTKVGLPQDIRVAAGAVEVRASAGGVRDLFTPFFVTVEILVDGRAARRFSASVEVEAFAPVVVAARDLAAGSRVSADDLKVETRRLERAPSLYLKDAAQARGASLRRGVARGGAVTSDLLAAETVVRPGDRVRVIAASGKLSVAVEGEARASGRVGDRISVRNLQSGSVLQARVIDAGLVSVSF